MHSDAAPSNARKAQRGGVASTTRQLQSLGLLQKSDVGLPSIHSLGPT